MGTSMREQLRFMERQAYRRAHATEYPFPLDGSDWAREVREHQLSERHPNCKCQTCHNLLNRWHEKNNMFIRERTMLLRAMHHWFVHDIKLMSDQLTAEELARLKVKWGATENEDNLAVSEEKWLMQKTYSRPDHPSDLVEHRQFDGLKPQLKKLESNDYHEAEGESNNSITAIALPDANQSESEQSDWDI